MDTDNNKTKLMCPYCDAVFDTKMEQDFCFTGSGCVTCGYSEYTGSIDIICRNCKKLIYRKEGIIIG